MELAAQVGRTVRQTSRRRQQIALIWSTAQPTPMSHVPAPIDGSGAPAGRREPPNAGHADPGLPPAGCRAGTPDLVGRFTDARFVRRRVRRSPSHVREVRAIVDGPLRAVALNSFSSQCLSEVVRPDLGPAVDPGVCFVVDVEQVPVEPVK